MFNRFLPEQGIYHPTISANKICLELHHGFKCYGSSLWTTSLIVVRNHNTAKTSDRLGSWASSDMGKVINELVYKSFPLLSSMWDDLKTERLQTVSQCDSFRVRPFGLLHIIFVWISTWYYWDEEFFAWSWVRAYLDFVGEHSAPLYLLFGAAYWSRQPKVIRRLMSPLLLHVTASCHCRHTSISLVMCWGPFH